MEPEKREQGGLFFFDGTKLAFGFKHADVPTSYLARLEPARSGRVWGCVVHQVTKPKRQPSELSHPSMPNQDELTACFKFPALKDSMQVSQIVNSLMQISRSLFTRSMVEPDSPHT